jgi:ubiquinone/menaquinone biosynthesis C-methylase UbiE
MTTVTDSTAGWQLDGDGAGAYERFLVPAIFDRFARDLVDLAAPAPGERVLDLGCGTGVVARHAAPRVGERGRVAGVDVNDGMLAVAAGIAPGIEWRQADAAQLPFGDGEFDVGLCEQALMFFPDRAAALGELRRVLAPDGRIALSVWRGLEHNWFYEAFAVALERHAGKPAGAMMRSPFPDWDAEQLRDMVAGAGFRDVRIRLEIGVEAWPSPAELLRREAASSPLAGPISALAGPARDALVAGVAHALRDYTDDERVVFPIETHVVTARR